MRRIERMHLGRLHQKTATHFRFLLRIVLALLVSSSPAQARIDFSDQEEEPSAVSSVQRFISKKDSAQALEVIMVEGDSPEAVFETLKQAQTELTIPTDSAQTRFTGIFDSSQTAHRISSLIRSADRPFQSVKHFAFKDKKFALLTPSSIRSTPVRSVASEEKRTRAEILSLHQQLKPQIGDRAKEYARLGDGIIKAEFDKSADKWLLVGLRTTVGGLGTAWGLTMSNIHPHATIAMAGSAALVSFITQMNLDNLGQFFSSTTRIEKSLLNLFLFRPFGYSWRPNQNTESSLASQLAKWYAVEVGLSETSKIAGNIAHTALPQTQQIVNGISQIPAQFQWASGLEDSASLAVDTLVSQGVYETIFNGDFNRRNEPYHQIAGYYYTLLKDETDPILQKRYLSIIDDCARLGKSSRRFRAVLANIGTATWILALALQNSTTPYVSKIASYSILGVAAGLKIYYNIRDRKEAAEFARVVGQIAREKLDPQVGASLSGSKNPIKRFAQAQCARVMTISDGFRKSVQEWRTEFASELVPINPRGAK